MLKRRVPSATASEVESRGGTRNPLNPSVTTSLHPGVSVDEVVAATGFELVIGDVDETRIPTDDELRLVDDVIDPDGVRFTEVKD